MEEATITCADKANKLGTKMFCFLSSDAKERSVPGSAQSVPAEQCQTRQFGGLPIQGHLSELRGRRNTKRPDLGYHSLPREGQSNHLSSLCSFPILISVLPRK